MAKRTTLLLRLLVMPLVLLAGILMISTSSHAATGYSPYLRRYPYLTDVVDSYATINWATDRTNSTGSVRYGLVGSESCTAHYVPAIRTAVSVNTVAEWQWKVLLNLTPGAQYCYRVYLGSGPATELDLLGTDASPVFWTQVPSGSNQPYSFVVFGDWGGTDSTGANPYQASLMSLIANSGARFALTAGDNGYPSGSQTNYGDLIQTGSAISAIFGPSFWKVPGPFTPIFPASGNHGITNSDPNHPLILNFPQTKAVALSGGRYVKETYCCLDGTTSANYPSAWYAFDAGLARIYVLDASWADSNIGTASSPYQVDHDYHWTATSPEYQWLQADLASHPSLIKMAVWHYPLYTDDNHQVSDTYLQGSGSLEGLLKQYGVLMGFVGHSHTYERNAASSVGFPNYVTGGGGAPLPLGSLGTCTTLDLYAIGYTSKGYSCKAPTPSVPDLVYHFLKVTVSGTSVTVTPINSLGASFDAKSYSVPSSGDTSAPSVPGGLTATAAPNGTEVDLSWQAATDNTAVRGYDIYRDGTLITQTDAATLSYADTNLRPAAGYTYTVDAFDGSGNHSLQSAPAPATTPSAATYVFNPVADSYVAGDNTTVNYGTSVVLKADGSPDYHSYLRFNVNETTGTITKATLSLYTTYSSSIGYQVSTVTSNAWDEGTVTYANAPALGPVVASSGPFKSGNWVSVDVTPLITGNGIYDLGISTTSTSSMSFNSRDAAGSWPQLIIQTSATPAVPTATFTATATPTAGVPATPTPTLAGSPTPTPTLASAALVFTPSDDATINQGSATTNYGSATSLNLSSQPVQDFLVKFTVSGMTGLPVTSVKLRLYNLDSSNRGGDLHRVADTSWLQGSVTWSNAPAYDATVLASYGSVSANTWTQLDVTPFITGDGTYSFMIVQASKNTAGYSSREGIAAPQLVVNYLVVPTATPTSAATATPTLAPLPTDTPTLAAPPTDTPTLAPLPTDTPFLVLPTDTPTTGPVATDTPTLAVLPTDTPTVGPLPTDTPTTAPLPTATNTPAPLPVFSDGFESGNLSKWTSGSGLVAESTHVHSGTYAVEGNTTNGATYLKKTLPSTYSDGYARIYFDIVSQASQVNLLRYRTSTGTSIGYVFVSATGKLALYSDATAVTTTSTTAVASGWHELEFHASIGGGFAEVWLDGAKVGSLSITTNLGTTPIGAFQIGEVQTGRTYDVVFDDVVFDTQLINP